MSEEEKPIGTFLVAGKGGSITERKVFAPQATPLTPESNAPAPETMPSAEPTFLDTIQTVRRLEKQQTRGPLSDDDEKELQAARQLGKQMIQEVEDAGGFEDLDDDLNSYSNEARRLRERSSQGTLQDTDQRGFLAELRSARRTAQQITNNEPQDQRHTGIREYYMTRMLREIEAAVETFPLATNNVESAPQPQNVPAETDAQTAAIREQIELLREQTEASKRAAVAAEQSRDHAKAQRILAEAALREQREYYALAQSGEEVVVYSEEQRARLNPEQFDQNPPLWWRKKNREEQGMIRARLHINYMAAVKRDAGMTNLEGVVGIQGLRIEKTHLVNMWNDMPGYRIAMATMVGDFFNIDSGLNHIEISEQGYALLENADDFDEYKDRLKQRLEKHFDENPDEVPRNTTLTNEQHAIAAVSTVDNLFFASGVYESGDIKRKLKNTKVWSEQIRALFMPGIKGKIKWVKGEIEDLPEGTEEGWGGPLGEWIRDRASNDPDFRRKLAQGEMRLIPDRLFFSMLDHTQLNNSDHPTFGAALVNTPQVDIGNGLYDFRDGADSINLMDIRPDDLYGGYADLRDSAVKLYVHLTGNDPKSKLSIPKVVEALNKLRGDPILSEVQVKNGVDLLHDEDLLLASIIMNVSPNGPIKGVSEIVLQPSLGDIAYDESVTQALADERLYVGMPMPSTRKNLFTRMNASDTSRTTGALKSIFVSDSFAGKRDRLRKQASRNRRIT